MSEFLVITGMSGAGRSQAADYLEDLGWFVVDNLPASLMEKAVELSTAPGSSIDKLALVVGTSRHQGDVLPELTGLESRGHQIKILFLEASTAELVKRYENTRRRHPLADVEPGLADAIEHERRLLDPVKAEADLVIDTSDLNVHQLKARVIELFGGSTTKTGLQLAIVSFGYKHGLPLDVDMVLDCRFLPNPYWVEELRHHTGLDADVSDYVLGQPATRTFLDHLDALFVTLLPAFEAEGKSYLTIAFGCTGGHHRSVALAEELARRFERQGYLPRVSHRDIAR